MFGSQLFKRSYHSIQHLNPEKTTNIATKILSHAIENHVPKLGFKEISILNASRDLGYNTSSILGVFERDPVHSLVQYNLSSKRLALADYYEELQQNARNITSNTSELQTQMVKNVMAKRLELNKPILNHYTEALSLMILPQNLINSMEELLKLADEICYLSNDKSNDFSWYSKRITVAGIYVECELHMLQQDLEFDRTIQFMNEKIDEFDSLGQAYNNVEEWSAFAMMSIINLIKSQLARG